MHISSPWVSAIAVAIGTIVGFILFANTRVHLPSSSSSTPLILNATQPVTHYVNSTQLAQMCLTACGAGGSCNQSPITGLTRCLTCGRAGDTISADTGACVNTADCVNWAWCTSAEATLSVRVQHLALVRVSYFGPGPLNFSYPLSVSRYNELQPFVPALAPTQAGVAQLLDLYVAGQLATGGGGANTVEYFDDEAGFWGSSLDLYKSVLPPLYGTGYIQVLKRKLCARAWKPSAGACIVPSQL